MRRKTFAAAVAATVALPAIAAGQTVTVIDNFTDGSFDPFNLTAGDGTPFEEQTQTGLSGVLGGTRTARLTDLESGSGPLSVAQIFTNPLGGRLTHSGGQGARSELQLSYDPDPAFDARNGFFSLDIVPSTGDQSFPSVDLTLTLTSGDGSSYGQTVTLLNNNETEFFQSSGFGDMGVDLADIDQIDLTFVGEFEDTGYVVGNFAFTTGPVPTPGAAALLGLGGLAAARRRRG